MKTIIDYARAKKRHPQIAAALLLDMNRKIRKAKQPVPDPSGMQWFYSWAVRIPCATGLSITSAMQSPVTTDPLDNCFISLELAHGNRSSIQNIVGSGMLSQVVARADIPQEIADLYAPKPGVDPASYPHIAQFKLTSLNDKQTDQLATGGYRTNKETFIHNVGVGDGLDQDGTAFETLLSIKGDHAVWSGALVGTAYDRYEATAEGGTFRYRNKTLHRLTSTEVLSIVSGKTFQFCT